MDTRENVPRKRRRRKPPPLAPASNGSGGVGLVLLRTKHGLGDAGFKLLQTL